MTVTESYPEPPPARRSVAPGGENETGAPEWLREELDRQALRIQRGAQEAVTTAFGAPGSAQRARDEERLATLEAVTRRNEDLLRHLHDVTLDLRRHSHGHHGAVARTKLLARAKMWLRGHLKLIIWIVIFGVFMLCLGDAL